MNENAMLTGKPSIDRPWMKFGPVKIYAQNYLQAPAE